MDEHSELKTQNTQQNPTQVSVWYVYFCLFFSSMLSVAHRTEISIYSSIFFVCGTTQNIIIIGWIKFFGRISNNKQEFGTTRVELGIWRVSLANGSVRDKRLCRVR